MLQREESVVVGPTAAAPGAYVTLWLWSGQRPAGDSLALSRRLHSLVQCADAKVDSLRKFDEKRVNIER